VSFTPDDSNYTTAAKDVKINVLKATPTINWSNPADIVYGTLLSGTQLNATASAVVNGVTVAVGGNFVYNPASGTLLAAGSNQNLHVDFTPTDTTDFNTASKDVKINVTPRPVAPAITAYDKPFDGNTTAVIKTCTVSPIVGSDDVACTGTANFASSSAGTWTVTSTDISLTGLSKGNYVLTTTSATTTATITQAVTTTAVTVTPTGQQYSDLVSFSATISPDNIAGQAPATGVSFYVGTQLMGSAPLVDMGSYLEADLQNVALLETVAGQMAPGAHTVTAVFTGVNPNFKVDSATTPLTITQEDARATYTGALFVSTGSPSSTTATVTLSATVFDISATPDAGGDTNPGDIRHATVTFINRDTNAVIASGLPVGLVNAGDTKVGTATYNWTINNVCSSPPCSASITVGIIVDNYYTRNSSNDDSVVTISTPGNDFITGGGYIVPSKSAGLAIAAPGTKNNFGFNVKYNKSGKSLQGNINTIIRSNAVLAPSGCNQPGLHVYQVKGNVMSSLAVNTTTQGGTATFNGKASIQDITSPQSTCAVDGNATLQVTMTDNGEPGVADTIGLTVWNKSGGLWYSSNMDATGKTVEQLLVGGNLSVH
jgi:hypothetical protein